MGTLISNHESSVNALPLACAPHVGQITDPKSLRLIEALHDATEQVQNKLRLDEFWGGRVDLPPGGLLFGRLPTVAKPRVRASYLAWPTLLTMDSNCFGKVCQAASCTHDELMKFVMYICPYEYLPHLNQFFSHEAVFQSIAKKISAAVQPMKAKQVRIQKGASTGGKKSALSRQKRSKIPSAEVLRIETEKLLTAGKAESETAGILSMKYGVSTQAIRLKRRQT